MLISQLTNYRLDRNDKPIYSLGGMERIAVEYEHLGMGLSSDFVLSMSNGGKKPHISPDPQCY